MFKLHSNLKEDNEYEAKRAQTPESLLATTKGNPQGLSVVAILLELSHSNGQRLAWAGKPQVGFQKLWVLSKKGLETAGINSDLLPLPFKEITFSVSEGLLDALLRVGMRQLGKALGTSLLLQPHSTTYHWGLSVLTFTVRPSFAILCKYGLLLLPTFPRYREGTKVSIRKDSVQLTKSQFPSGEEKSHTEPETFIRTRLVPRKSDLHREYSVIWGAIPGASDV